jgi:hypothetical protein
MSEIIIGDRSEGVIVSVPQAQGSRSLAEGWADAEVAVQLGAWAGRYAAQFHVDDLSHFGSGVAALSATLTGEALLSSMDGFLDVHLTGDGKGHVAVKGEAWDRPRWGTHLGFEFEIDQTFLPAILASVEASLTDLEARKEGDHPLP